MLLIGGGIGFAATRGDSGSSPTSRSAASPPATPATTPSEPAEPATTTATPQESATPPAATPPLDIAAPYRNLACTGGYVVILATSGDRTEYESKLGDAVRDVPGAKYLKGAESCSAFIARDPVLGDDVYNAYVGPYATFTQACRAQRGLTSETAWVRQLADPSKTREMCLCLSSATALPTITPGQSARDVSVRRLVSQVQWILYVMHRNSREHIYGAFTDELGRQLTAYQADTGLVATGILDTATWGRLQDDYCPAQSFSVS